jgi:hypothetical protein
LAVSQSELRKLKPNNCAEGTSVSAIVDFSDSIDDGRPGSQIMVAGLDMFAYGAQQNYKTNKSIP